MISQLLNLLIIEARCPLILVVLLNLCLEPFLIVWIVFKRECGYIA